ncbi:hypothetical protein [Lichenihabitans sp. Uapishka_5]|uniref:hypothetical protein n=1 Tax=Lichenihabitans sp. Uapishka_5 TaxID=3037302 RepID=UPI003FA57FD9
MFGWQQLAAVRDMLGQGTGPVAISKATGISHQAVYRIKADPAAGMLINWGCRQTACPNRLAQGVAL